MQELSEEERYRQRLFMTMQDSGLVDNLKVKIRQKLIEKLQHERVSKDVEPDKLFVKKLCSSLFADYLQCNQLDYTLSVFTPECGFSNSLLVRQQLASLLRLTKGSESSLLQSMVNQQLPRRSKILHYNDAEQQTDDSSTVESLQLKLRYIEESFKQNTVSNSMLKLAQDREEREVKYKNELNKRYREELNSELKRLREFEIMNVRLEQRERYHMQLKQAKEQFEIKYREKLGKLKTREDEVIQRVTDKMKEIESFNHQNRQKVLKDLEMIRLKEQELARLKDLLDERQKNLHKSIK